MWTVSKLRTHSAVTPTVISRRVQVGEQIAGAKWAVKRAIQDADQHDRSEQYAQQQTPDQRRRVNGAAAADDDMPTCGAGTVRSSDSDFIYLGERVVLRDRLGSDGVPPRAAVRPLLALCMPAGTGWTTFNPRALPLASPATRSVRAALFDDGQLTLPLDRTHCDSPSADRRSGYGVAQKRSLGKEQIVAAGYEAKRSRRN